MSIRCDTNSGPVSFMYKLKSSENITVNKIWKKIGKVTFLVNCNQCYFIACLPRGLPCHHATYMATQIS